MNILIVDGNEKKASQKYTELGMQTQYEVYQETLESLSEKKLSISIIHPTYSNESLSLGIDLDNFHGIVWTGSVLNIYEGGPAIKNQIELAKNLLRKKNKIFGSCWGLQVLVSAAGGTVRKNPKGLEAVISKNISLNNKGIKHPMYNSKPRQFNSFCWHYDEIESLPENSNILSSNDKSSVQSLVFNQDESEVWAVQYHPEFNPKWMSGLMLQRKQLLLDEKIFSSKEKFQKMQSYLSDINKFKNLKDESLISNSIINKKIHTIELKNWLNHIKNDI
tara:strand:- start:200 stop:1030 length:831 start_codon:yes stop_codon:yes gene_type:complete